MKYARVLRDYCAAIANTIGAERTHGAPMWCNHARLKCTNLTRGMALRMRAIKSTNQRISFEAH